MIGSRTIAAAVAVVTVAAFGGGAPRPEVDAGGRRAVEDAADEVLALAANLRQRLGAAVDEARTGAARVVAGTAPPAGPLIASSTVVLDAAPIAADLERATERLERARRAWHPGAAALEPEPPPASELVSIAGQLSATAEAGDAFAVMRRRAEGLTSLLAAALADAESGDLDAAADRVRTAREEAEILHAWEVDAVTLPVWLETVDAMIDAMDRTIDALERGDAADAADAAEAFDALAEDAPSADRALRIGIGEAGSALTFTALGRLAGSLGALDGLTLAVQSARAEVAG